ncbi:hypothetical protein [Nannocystis pusilla]|uniref:hypothetical protein n=1 Tax=Nannocystis pusilla TaxID=889268 RepID=UPI003DA26CA3
MADPPTRGEDARAAQGNGGNSMFFEKHMSQGTPLTRDGRRCRRAGHRRRR